MKIKIPILNEQKIKWVGTTNFPELYKYMKLWFEDNGYGDKDDIKKTIEQNYMERIRPEGKKQLEIKWHAEKKKSEFFKYHIEMTILILGMSDVEVQQGDIKRKMQKGTFEIRVTSYIESTKTWDELKGLQKLYQELFLRKRLDVYMEEIYKKSMSFFSYIKTFLGLRD